MKKILTTAALSTALIMSGATVAMATHAQIPAETSGVVAMGATVVIDGSVRVRGFTNHTDAKDNASNTGYDGRARLGVKARVSDEVMGYIQLETGSNNGDNWNWGKNTSTTGLSKGGEKDDTDGDMELLQAWLDYSPGDWGLKAGHMPIALGNKLFYDHTGSGDDALQFYANMAGTHVTANIIKLIEQVPADNSDDIDAYMLSLDRKFSDNFKGAINYTYVDGSSDNDDDGTTTPAQTASLQGLELSNIGITLDYKMDALTIKADAEFQFGDYFDDGTASTKRDAEGQAFLLSADYKMDNANVGLLFAYGSGDDNGNDTDEERFINFLTDTPYQVYIPGYRQATPGSSTFAGTYTAGASANQSGLQNMTLYQINASTSTTCMLTGKPLSIRGALSYMETSEDVTVGTTREDEIGTELDIVGTWKLSDGLSYKVELAYLWSGDAWKDTATDDPDDAFFLRHGLEMTF